MKKIYIVVFTVMVLLSVTMSATADVNQQAIRTNVDNIVDYKDLGQLGASYVHSLGDAGYNANVDLNNDGTVDYKDLGILGAHYGEQT